jgi:hypothetical protein
MEIGQTAPLMNLIRAQPRASINQPPDSPEGSIAFVDMRFSHRYNRNRKQAGDERFCIRIIIKAGWMFKGVEIHGRSRIRQERNGNENPESGNAFLRARDSDGECARGTHGVPEAVNY